MKVIIIAGQKGGAGKTTIAVHLATEALRRGLRVGIVDADPQLSATAWANARLDTSLPVVAAAGPELNKALDLARDDKFDLIIIDSPPHATAATQKPYRLADLIVLPVRPSVFDLAALPASLDMVESANTKAAFVISSAPIRASEIIDTRRELEKTGFPVFDTVIHDRTPYRRAIASGQAVSEFEPKGKAAFEIRDLWNEITFLLSTEKEIRI
jgi:chromosome partitioning protein